MDQWIGWDGMGWLYRMEWLGWDEMVGIGWIDRWGGMAWLGWDEMDG